MDSQRARKPQQAYGGRDYLPTRPWLLREDRATTVPITVTGSRPPGRINHSRPPNRYDRSRPPDRINHSRPPELPHPARDRPLVTIAPACSTTLITRDRPTVTIAPGRPIALITRDRLNYLIRLVTAGSLRLLPTAQPY
ncbi:hypothetical protein F4861DRAFT_544476 [Xylaria intraflava]|nr:hypothetical protein F4861DRAFT_544476 [Xylaria intraflava]